ncbi:MAG: mechanosensitive ion channel family protein [Promethearchaeota archaeon]
MTNKKEVKGFFGRGLIKAIVYILILGIILFLVNYIFGYSEISTIPDFLLPISGFILLLNPYLIWIQVLIVLILGALIVNSISKMVYDYTEERSGEATASSLKTIIRIVGFAILLGVTISLIGVDPTVAITISSFLGIAIGFAAQNVLGNILAGIVLVINRPFKPGETVTVSGRTGVVKEITLTRTRLLLPDGKTMILIPSSVILTSTIQRPKREGEK